MGVFNLPHQNQGHSQRSVLIENFEIPGGSGQIPVRLYRPDTGKLIAGPQSELLPVVLYFHGGGFIGGTLDDADVPAQFIAGQCPAAVLSVGYSLAPERPFPAAPEDAYAATEWVLANGKTLQVDPLRLAVAGDDAGGNLAACLMLIARDRNASPIAAQVLIGPMLDPSMTQLGDAARLKSDLSAETCADCYRQYLPRILQRMHPYASPMESRRLSGLPPAFVATAECDVLHNEAEKYAAALIAVGVHTQVARYAGIKHADLRSHPPLLAEVVAFLRRRLYPAGNANNS
ncbi:MAG: alpha/beta hydrolase [Pseudomonadota bacterium]